MKSANKNYFSLMSYFKDVIAEFDKIQWLKQKEIIPIAVSVVVVTIISALFFSIIDILFSFILSKLI